MKIFFHIHGSFVDELMQIPLFNDCLKYNDFIVRNLDYGSITKNAAPSQLIDDEIFICWSNSKKLQFLWAKENGVFIDNHDWKRSILQKQIESFQPDVFYSLAPEWIIQNKDLIEFIKLKAIWKASPIIGVNDLSFFDLALTYGDIYKENLRGVGMNNIHKLNFAFDINTINRLDTNPNLESDLSFSGTYADMFSKRNKLLYSLSKEFYPKYKLRYYLKTSGQSRYFFKLFPEKILPPVPLRLMAHYRKNVFLKEYLESIANSKIVFNCHSDIAQKDKGNMRCFEALGLKRFMLSDKGVYPDYFKDGEHFVSYSNEKDLKDKFQYFIKNDTERNEIAENGFKMIKEHYQPNQVFNQLKEIFYKHL